MMKIKPNDKVKVKVLAEGEEGLSNNSYNGEWAKVLNKISKNHSYGWVVGEDDGDGVVSTCEGVLESIIETNGDGCDFILKMVVEKGGKKQTVIDEEIDEEDIDCD